MKRLFTFCLSALIFLTSLPVTKVNADPYSPAPLSPGTYADVFASGIASIVTKPQPNTALVLNESETEPIVLSTTNSSYGDNIWVLPTLDAHYSYYITDDVDHSYDLVTNDAVAFDANLNAIYLKDAVTADSHFLLFIWSTGTSDVLTVYDVVFDDDFSATAPVPYTSQTYDDLVLLDVETTYYNPDIIIEGGFVTEHHIGIPQSLIATDTVLTADLYTHNGEIFSINDAGIIDMTVYESTLEHKVLKYKSRASTTCTNPAVYYLAAYVSSGAKSTLQHMFRVAPSTNSFYVEPANTGSIGMLTTFEFVCDNAYITLTYDPDLESNPSKTYTVEPGDTVQIAYDFSTYGLAPVDADTVKPSSIAYDGGIYHVNSVFASEFKLDGEGYCGINVEDFATVKPRYTPTQYKVVYSPSSDYTYDPEYHNCNSTVTLRTPTKAYYQFDGWYTDESLSTPFNTSGNYAGGSVVTVYPKWTYNGGSYTVRFYDAFNNTSETKDFRVIDQPTLPSNPHYTGYNFKYWMIVTNTSSNTGVVYDPATFIPAKNNSYIFKAAYGISGVIKSVTNAKSSYYVGEDINKDNLTVIVQVDDSGATRTLSSDEFSISPTKIDTTGTITVTLRYDATGATTTFKLTGYNDNLTSLVAKYNGQDLNKGDVIPVAHISVTGVYASGKTENISSFTINPTTVRNQGSNNITVSYGTISTTLTINANSPQPNQVKENSSVVSVTATYIGQTKFVGDNLLPSDFRVTATHSDGSTSRVSTNEFTFTPNVLKSVGTNTVSITYGGLTTTCVVSAVEQKKTNNVKNNTTSNNRQPSNTYEETTAETTASKPMPKQDAKGPSPYYIRGLTVLNMKHIDSNDIHYVALSEVIAEAQENTIVTVDIYNGYDTNILTPDDFSLMREKSLVLNVNVLDDRKYTSVAKWSINGKVITEFSDTMNLNVLISNVDKAVEKMHLITIADTKYPLGTTFSVFMPGQYATGTYVTCYSCDSKLNDSHKLFDTLWNSAGEVSLQLAHSPYYALTDATVQYEDGSSLLEEFVKDTVDTPTEIEEEKPEDIVEEEVTTPTPIAKPDKHFEIKTSTLVVILVVVLALIGILSGVLVFLKRRG